MQIITSLAYCSEVTTCGAERRRRSKNAAATGTFEGDHNTSGGGAVAAALSIPGKALQTNAVNS